MIGKIEKVNAARGIVVLGEDGNIYDGKFEDCVGFFPIIGACVNFDPIGCGNKIKKKSVKIKTTNISEFRKFPDPDGGENSSDCRSNANLKKLTDDKWRFRKSIIYIFLIWVVCLLIGEISSGVGWFLFIFVVLPLTFFEFLKVISYVVSGIFDITGK